MLTCYFSVNLSTLLFCLSLFLTLSYFFFHSFILSRYLLLFLKNKGKGLAKFKALGKKTILLNKVSGAFEYNKLLSESRGLDTLEAIGEAIRDMTLERMQTDTKVHDNKKTHNNENDDGNNSNKTKNNISNSGDSGERVLADICEMDFDWMAALSYLCSSFFTLYKNGKLNSSHTSTSSGISPFMLSGGVRASCIHSSSSNSNYASSSTELEPVWALFQLRVAPSMSELAHIEQDEDDSGSVSKAKQGVYRVVIFLGSEGSEADPDWLPDLFNGVNEVRFPLSLSLICQVSPLLTLY